MKTQIISLLIILILGVSSCDKVEMPYKNDIGEGEDTTVEFGTIPDDAKRKILFEDFTAHKCPNCPGAHAELEDLKSIYGDRLVIMVEHVGWLARPGYTPYEYDFRTPEGNDIDAYYSASDALPKGMVNRMKFDGSYLVDVAAYGSAISSILDNEPVEPDMYLEMDADFNSVDSTINVDINMIAGKAMPQSLYNVVIYVTESEIEKAQSNNDTTLGDTPHIEDYIHNEVLRGSINSTWGEIVTSKPILENQLYRKSYTGYKIGSDWNPNHLHLVAVFYYADGENDKVVIQAEEIDLM